MPTENITVATVVNAPVAETWMYYTEAEHVINWNFASSDWHCPRAENDLRAGGDFTITMAAKDGSMSFDLEGTYDEVREPNHIAYTLTNGRKVSVDFTKVSEGTELRVAFQPESEQPHDVQQNGWQAILDNFAKYVRKMEG